MSEAAENVARLPARKRAVPASKHAWNAIPVARMAGIDFEDGNDRTLRTCANCGLIKVTVHAAGGSHAWREWRTQDGQVWRGELTPPCFGNVEDNQ